MRNKRYSIVMGLIVMFSTICSCEKILEQEPRNATFSDAFWASSRDLSSALAGNYALLRAAMMSGNGASGSNDFGARYYMYGDAIAQHYFTMQYTGDGLEGIQTGDFTFQYNIESLGDWTPYFKAVTMSNIIINRVPDVADDLLTDVTNPTRFKDEIVGEAYFLRALAYFMMVRVWGDVPLVLEEYEDPISAPELTRSPKEEVMAQIEADCHQSASLLTWSYSVPGDAKVTANRGSVYALLAHFYLWRATMTDVSNDEPIMADVLSADTTLQALMANGGYRLTDTANYYDTFVGRSPEGIFEIGMSEDNLEGSNRHIGRLFLRRSYLATASATNSRCYVNPAYLNGHFYKLGTEWGWVWNEPAWEWQWQEMEVRLPDEGDVRYRKGFVDVSTDRPTAVKYHNVIYRNAAQQTNPYISNNTIVFRLGDMHLLQAEVALHKGDLNTAKEIINESRVRNGADPSSYLADGLSKDELLYEYMIERGKEMFLEGHLFYDLLRTRQYATFITWLSESRFRQQGFYWPVAPQLFRNNVQLRQTEYWRGKV